MHNHMQINKQTQCELFNLMTRMCTLRCVQVAYMQGATQLTECEYLFGLLCKIIANGVLWSINLGEIKFSPHQYSQLLQAIGCSEVTHMFLECVYLPPRMKDHFRAALRTNRTKHSMWKLSGDTKQDSIIKSVHKNW